MFFIKKYRKLSRQEYQEFFHRFMFSPDGSIIEYPDDVSPLDLYPVFIEARDRRKTIFEDIRKYGGTFPEAYIFK